MPDVIEFLESLGARPACAAIDYEAAVANLAVDQASREALVRRDAGALAAALGGRDAMWCAIMSPDDTPSEDQPRRDEPSRDEPSRDNPQPDQEED